MIETRGLHVLMNLPEMRVAEKVRLDGRGLAFDYRCHLLFNLVPEIFGRRHPENDQPEILPNGSALRLRQ